MEEFGVTVERQQERRDGEYTDRCQANNKDHSADIVANNVHRRSERDGSTGGTPSAQLEREVFGGRTGVAHNVQG